MGAGQARRAAITSAGSTGRRSPGRRYRASGTRADGGSWWRAGSSADESPGGRHRALVGRAAHHDASSKHPFGPVPAAGKTGMPPEGTLLAIAFIPIIRRPSHTILRRSQSWVGSNSPVRCIGLSRSRGRLAASRRAARAAPASPAGTVGGQGDAFRERAQRPAMAGSRAGADHGTNNLYHLPGGRQVGAINQVAIDPSNPNHLVVATVNGGIWSTTPDSTENDPQWVPLTDQMPSLSTGSIAFSPLDSNTLFAGTDDFSSYGGDGAPSSASTGPRTAARPGPCWGASSPARTCWCCPPPSAHRARWPTRSSSRLWVT